jgi:ribonucleoside-diphosphate reductase alpha chain
VAELSPNAETVCRARYFIDDKEDWQGLALRQGLGAAITPDEKLHWVDRFSEVIYNKWFMPAGRILRNMGRMKGSLLNCFVLPVEDTIESIAKLMHDSMITWSEGGGVGTSFVDLRPEGAPILAKGGYSSGPNSFLQAQDGVGQTIETGGQRRAAGMAIQGCWHPDIEKFVRIKSDHNLINCFNLSVALVPEFLQAVEDGGKWDLTFQNKHYKTITARMLWSDIVHNMVDHAEPGLLNWPYLRENNSYYFDPILATNPCGEAPLPAHGVCDLGSIVLPQMTLGTRTNWMQLEYTIRTAVRFLDNVLDVNRYILPEYKEGAQRGRRIGLGVTGVAEYLFKKKIRYGSSESLDHLDKLMAFIRNISYEESVRLAEEKGSFPAFESDPFSKARFVKGLPRALQKDIHDHGIRNVQLLAMAPAGSISLVADCTSGIEPLFSRAYWRADRISTRAYVHPKLRQCIEAGVDVPDWFVDSTDLSKEDHINVQAVIQKHTDGAVSKTINLPEGTCYNEVSDFILENLHRVKGMTIYVDGCRGGQPLNHMTISEVKEACKTEDDCNERDEAEVACATGACSLD